MTTNKGREGGRHDEPLPGIVITEGRRVPEIGDPKISAFIWGGKVQPTPALPYGRAKGAA